MRGNQQPTNWIHLFHSFRLFLFLSHLPWEPGLDKTAQPDCYIGEAFLCLKRISATTNRSKEATQTAVPDSVLFGYCILGAAAGIWKCRKGLSHHHIAAGTERDISLFFFCSFEWSLLQLLIGVVFKLQLISSLSYFAFSCLTLSEINACIFYREITLWKRNYTLLLRFCQKGSPKHHMKHKNTMFCGERICKIIQPDGLLNAASPCSQWTLGTF